MAVKMKWKGYSLKEKCKKVLRLLKEKGPSTITVLAKNFGVSQPTAAKYLEVLNARGKLNIKYYGPAKVYSVKKRIRVA